MEFNTAQYFALCKASSSGAKAINDYNCQDVTGSLRFKTNKIQKQCTAYDW